MSRKKKSFPSPRSWERRWKNQSSEIQLNYLKQKETDSGPQGWDINKLFNFNLQYLTGKQDSKNTIYESQDNMISLSYNNSTTSIQPIKERKIKYFL